MSPTPLSFDRYLDDVSADAARLAALAGDTLDRGVPTCPDWTVRDLVDHLWHVYRFWLAQVLAADAAAPFELGEDAPPESGEPGDRLAVAADELVDALRAAGGEAPCWNWSGRNATTGWLARRMALESAIHRYDGELAAAEARAIDPQLSVDGIDEFLTVHLRTDLPDVPAATLGGSLCLACTDTEDAWTVDVGGGRLRVRNDRGPASACLRGGASDLFLFVWNRVGVDGLELTGDRAVAEAWASLPH